MMADEEVKFKVLEHNVVDALISDVQFLTDDEYSTCVMLLFFLIFPYMK